MARKIKFALEMANGVKVRSNLEELRENFDIDKAVGHFLSGKLVEWLEDRYYEDEAEQISALDKDSLDFRQKLCDALGVEYEGGENLDVEFLARLNEKKNYLRQKTDEKSIVANADKTALNQEDLSDLLDIDEPIIYLCGENFNIPIRVENKKYVGILGTPKIEIKANSRSELDAKNINFENCILPNNLQEKKKSVSPVNVTSIHGGSSSSGSYKNRKSISELQSILVNCYEPMHIHAQDRDYGDLWHINHGGEFVDERFERIRKSFTKGDEPINDREKAFALPLICHGRYGESDLVRIGVIREEKKAIGNQTEADRYIGFALTKDSF